jgi:sphinganine-1-phosphate aldolase
VSYQTCCFFFLTDWSGGLYYSPTFAGSRPGGLIAACWASMLRMGEDGYMHATDAIFRAAHALKTGIRARIPDLRILGAPLWVIALAAADPSTLNIYRVLDAMSDRGWSLNGLHRPPCIHICLTLRHCAPGVIERFLSDLSDCVKSNLELDRSNRTGKTEGMAPIYGLGGTMPARGVVSDLLLSYMDLLYKV